MNTFRSATALAVATLLVSCSLLVDDSNSTDETEQPDFGCDGIVARDVGYIIRLDLDEDGIDDFALGGEYIQRPAVGAGGGETVWVCSAGYSAALQDGEGIWAVALEKGVTIGARVQPYQWEADPVRFFTLSQGRRGGEPYVSRRGPWADGGAHYLGLKIFDGGSIHYGWAEMKVDTSLSASKRVTLEDYAYNPEPGQPVRAGYEE